MTGHHSSEGSYPFSIYSGLLTPGHFEKIGHAVWLFLWCISSTTREVERDGVTWGIVLGHKPLKAAELGLVFGVNERTVRRWLSLLEKNGYISVRRAPYGFILSVKHSKKFLHQRRAGHVRSEAEERTNEPASSDRPVRLNKDMTQIGTNNASDPVETIAERFAALRSAQEGRLVHPSPKDYQAIARIVARGVPLPQTIKWLERCFSEYESRRRSRQETIKVFGYCEKYIMDRITAMETNAEARRDNIGKANDRRRFERAEKQEPSITGGQTGRIRRKHV
ncbi:MULTISPECIES: phage portal protein [Bacillus]|uniref:Phage portal protein n=1 Tax=Bacillus glycinifermentans TaxID=1664069 RepID=A0AAJ4D1U7_9BACI|nr:MULTISPECIES: phage portal protein [Bacillus]KKB73276.1 phage portal protein [Bacillus sp. TH008]MDU0069475.1 phage portal protein [Bacillus sp. IG6]MED8017545.1 phage portal protein [Bacillus glycinifermentans]QAT64770.1 phage portal protein [Bacillus glycinifermentans]WKB78641.1 phage portal protein [Bacillus glycinifermentans]